VRRIAERQLARDGESDQGLRSRYVAVSETLDWASAGTAGDAPSPTPRGG